MGTKKTMDGKDIYDYIWEDYRKLEKNTKVFLDKVKKVAELRAFLYHFQSISDLSMVTDDENECYQIDGGDHIPAEYFEKIRSVMEEILVSSENELNDLANSLKLPNSILEENITVV